MNESVYDIEAGDDPVAGWHPGTPGNEVGGRRAARLAAAAAAAAASAPSAPSTDHPVPTSSNAVYDLSTEPGWGAPSAWGGSTLAGATSTQDAGASWPPPAGDPVAVPVAQPQAAPATPPAAVPPSTAAYGYADTVTEHLPVAPAAATTSLQTVQGIRTGPGPTHGRAVDAVSHPEIGFTRHAREVADADLITALSQVVYQGASDLHVTADAPPTVRVDGSLRPAVPGGPWARNKVIAALKTLLTPEQA